MPSQPQGARPIPTLPFVMGEGGRGILEGSWYSEGWAAAVRKRGECTRSIISIPSQSSKTHAGLPQELGAGDLHWPYASTRVKAGVSDEARETLDMDDQRSWQSQSSHACSGKPEQRRMMLEDPSLVPAAVEESLRMFPAFAHFARTATRHRAARAAHP